MTGLLSAGESYLRLAGTRRPFLVASLALPTGAALVALVGMLATLTRLPVRPAVAVGGLAGSLLLVSTSRRVRSRRDWLLLGGLVATIWLLVLLITESQVAILTLDSFAYGKSAALFRDGTALHHTAGLLERRSMGLAYVHAIAINVTGASFLPTLSPLLAICCLVFLGYASIRALSAGGPSNRATVTVGLLLILMVMTSHRMAYAAFYMNSHMWVATCVAIVSGMALLTVIERDRSGIGRWEVAVAPSLAALVLLRPEGALLGVLLIYPVVVWTWANIDRSAKSLLLIVLGATTLLWHAAILWPRFENVPTSVIGMSVVGLVILATPMLLRPDRTLPPRLTVPATWAVIVGATALMAIVESDTVVRSANATYQNVIRGEGLWGASLVLLIIGATLAWLLYKSPPTVVPMFPFLAYLPVALFLAIARGGAYRVGPGDSFNRMLIHLVPLLVLGIAASLSGSPRWARTASP